MTLLPVQSAPLHQHFFKVTFANPYYNVVARNNILVLHKIVEMAAIFFQKRA